jgi:hypothetical protein
MDNDYEGKIKWLKKNQVDVREYPISFSLEWKGWKLINEKPFIVPNGKRNLDKYMRQAKDFQYKIVSRACGRLLSEYLFMFATEAEDMEIPFFMMNKDEIQKVHKPFAERVDIDTGSDSILFSLDDGTRYKMYNYQIEKRKNDADQNLRKDIVCAFLKDLLPRSIYYGDFDPDPLVAMKNGKVKLVVSGDIPRWCRKI